MGTVGDLGCEEARTIPEREILRAGRCDEEACVRLDIWMEMAVGSLLPLGGGAACLAHLRSAFLCLAAPCMCLRSATWNMVPSLHCSRPLALSHVHVLSAATPRSSLELLVL